MMRIMPLNLKMNDKEVQVDALANADSGSKPCQSFGVGKTLP